MKGASLVVALIAVLLAAGGAVVAGPAVPPECRPS